MPMFPLVLALLAILRSRTPNSHQSTPIISVRHPRLSLPVSSLKPSYDVVVIGSGYGSGVAASRFARAGKKVCVLERGAERWPGEYPHTAKGAMHEYEVSGTVSGRRVRLGKRAGLYQTIKGQGQDVFMGCGLGGTSLINAGVWLRPDERVLRGTEWPVEIREQGLDKYYDRAEQVFQPTPYPLTYATPAKLSALETLARSLGLQDSFYRPPLTTSFRNEINHAGVRMQAGTGSGNECTGTNDGSKNSVLVTYLADAWSRGAELFCGIDVQCIKKRESSEGYIVFFHTYSPRGTQTLSWVIAKHLLILGAGALSTPTILLRSRLHGLTTSSLLGQRLSGNGDMLNFAYNTAHSLNSVGRDGTSQCGPTITGCIDLRGPRHTPENVRNGFVVQDGAMPEVLAPIVQVLLETHRAGGSSRAYNFVRGTFARCKAWVLGPYALGGSVNRTLVFLTMSHDEDHGIISLANDSIAVKWEGASLLRTSCVDALLSKMTELLGGVPVKSPLMTVHPLGGAVMSCDGTGRGGVVTHCGELLAGLGDEVHGGIFCVDGAVVPGSLGVNPCATITALAERICDLIIKERGWEVDESPNGELDLFGDPPYSREHKSRKKSDSGDDADGVRFEETMQGHIHVGPDITDFITAESVAKAVSSSAHLAMTVGALRTGQESYIGSAQGVFACGALSPDPLIIIDGLVAFFEIDEDVADAVKLVYKIQLLSTTGATYTLHGFKTIDPSITLSVRRTWRATTTLFTTITSSDGAVLGRGILHLPLRAFISQVRSLRSHRNTTSQTDTFLPLTKFLSFFALNILSYFLSPFRPLQHPPSTNNTSTTDTSTTPPIFFPKPTPTTTSLTTSDGLSIPLKIWPPPPGTKRKRTPMLFLPGAAVNDQIFSLPTIRVNAIDYFTALGYTCYVPVLRFGWGENATYGFTAFDARLDVKAVVEYVYNREERRVYVVAHCLGSIALGMGVLRGDVDVGMLAGLTVSQVFMNILFSPDNGFKARHPVLMRAYETLARSPWFPTSTPFPQTIPWLDHLLRFYPIGPRKELCRSATCHACNVPFGRCWTHANLTHSTHALLHTVFSGVHTSFLRHLSHMGASPPYHLTSNPPYFTDLVTPTNLLKLRGLPILFLHGGENAVWDTRATKASYDTLREAFPEGRYERAVISGYGHLDCWMGKDAGEDVWGWVRGNVGGCEEDESEGDGGNGGLSRSLFSLARLFHFHPYTHLNTQGNQFSIAQGNRTSTSKGKYYIFITRLLRRNSSDAARKQAAALSVRGLGRGSGLRAGNVTVVAAVGVGVCLIGVAVVATIVADVCLAIAAVVGLVGVTVNGSGGRLSSVAVVTAVVGLVGVIVNGGGGRLSSVAVVTAVVGLVGVVVDGGGGRELLLVIIARGGGGLGWGG
ncbi:FAD/NAD(P)-binding domain-containing protein [Ophiobolus disseminans]|uniref:FAD/NAD(P)-binding domain-containing protein n=1 Tax=Ophiobolus disseminans TaxID=1469910 RepID=A0A6A6ZL34_9PLEO|nr:FAD/NAD(P)-binding domain-containing protein [Ophiobolus disseminans]